MGSLVRTSTVGNNVHPIWDNEVLELPVSPHHRELVAEVFDEDDVLYICGYL